MSQVKSYGITRGEMQAETDAQQARRNAKERGLGRFQLAVLMGINFNFLGGFRGNTNPPSYETHGAPATWRIMTIVR